MRQRARTAMPIALLSALTAWACKSPPPPADSGGRADPVADTADAAKADATVAAAASATGTPPAPAAETEGTPVASASADAFALSLFRAVARTKANALVSGPSVRDALGIVYLGALDKTAEELRSTLALAATPDKAAEDAARAARAWSAARGEAELSIANRLWVDATGITLVPAFVARVSKGYGAAPAQVPFQTNAEGARGTINGWVSEHTKSRIPALIPQNGVTSLTRVVVTNAVFFNGKWEQPFSKGGTREGFFHVDSEARVTVPTMHQQARFAYAADGGTTAVELRYAKSKLAMLLLLPDGGGRLDALEAGLTPERLKALSGKLAPRELSLFLPKVTFKVGGSIVPALKALGVRRAFAEEAELEGIAPVPRDLYVSQVFHEASVAIDEEGTVAAAATAVMMATRGVPAPALEVRFDRPFVFVIRDTSTGALLFVGRVQDPSKT